MQQTVGEHVSALTVGCELNFVHRKKFGRNVERHGLDCRDPMRRRFGNDLLFAGDERDGMRAFDGSDLIVHLARKQAQR